MSALHPGTSPPISRPVRPTLDLDANATRPVAPAAWDAYHEATQRLAGAGNARAQAARALLQAAREQVAAAFAAHPAEVVFAGGGSHADALALWAAAACASPAAATAVLSAFEHRAMDAAASALRDAGRLRVRWAPVTRSGRVEEQTTLAACEAGTTLLSILYAHNETGVVQPWQAIAAALHRRQQREGIEVPPLLHADAVQAAGRLRIALGSSPANLLSISGHKLGAVGGTGALLVKRGSLVHRRLIDAADGPWRDGDADAQESVGAADPALMSSLGAACGQLASTVAATQRLAPLRDEFECQLAAKLGASRWPSSQGNGSPTSREKFGAAPLAADEQHLQVIGRGEPRLSNTSLVRVVGVPAEALLIALDLVGYAVSHGAACSAGAVEPSASLLAMGFSTEEAKQCIRISLHAHAAPAALAAGLSGLVEAIASFVQRARSAAF